MATAKLPYHISVLTDELKDCVEDITHVLKHLTHLIESLSSKKKVCLYKKPKPWVLLVESNPTLCYIHQRLLEELGCEVEVAVDSIEALRMINRGYDFVLLNTNLPQMNGIELAMSLAREKEKAEPCLIGVTEDKDEPFRKKCLEAGIKAVITIPLDYSILRDLIPINKEDGSC